MEEKIKENQEAIISKVEIINIPEPQKQKNTIMWFGLVISILAALVSASSLCWAIHTFNQLLPLQEANVIFSESDIFITQTNECEKLKPNLNSISCDIINFKIKNEGRVNADNIKYNIYSINLPDQNINFPEDLKIQELFNEPIINALPPGGIMTVNGQIFSPHYANDILKKEKVDLRGKMSSVLVFYIEYADKISGSKENIFFFSQVLGGDKVFNLSSSDYGSIKNSFVKYLENKNKKQILKKLKEIKLIN